MGLVSRQAGTVALPLPPEPARRQSPAGEAGAEAPCCVCSAGRLALTLPSWRAPCWRPAAATSAWCWPPMPPTSSRTWAQVRKEATVFRVWDKTLEPF